MRNMMSAFILVVCLAYFTEAQGMGRCRYKKVWYDDGVYFDDVCNLCVCNIGQVLCSAYDCAVTCDEDGTNYNGNEPMPPFDDACLFCECDRSSGEKICASFSCPEPVCNEINRYTPDGECCQQCGCVYDNQWYSFGEPITPDPCTTCSCELDQMDAVCVAIGCAPLTCNDYSVGDGECCPKCKCVWNNKVYLHGEQMQRGPDCNECPVCVDGERVCEGCP